jgi:hypothetical protein
MTRDGGGIETQAKITRAMIHFCALGLAAFAGSSGGEPAAPSSTLVAPPHPRILVVFANTPQRPPGPAGTTRGRYKGEDYVVAQTAYRAALNVAADYSLRLVASWPIKALAVHCVVYEIPDDRSVSNLLAALATDARVAFAQPMNDFRTQAHEH